MEGSIEENVLEVQEGKRKLMGVAFREKAGKEGGGGRRGWRIWRGCWGRGGRWGWVCLLEFGGVYGVEDMGIYCSVYLL